VTKVNDAILDLIPGQLFCSVSLDEPDSNFVDPVTPEILNNIDFPGFLKHRLFLKVGQPVMVLRNLSIGSGLCNGTRLVVLNVSKRILKCVVITGPKKGEIIALHKMRLIHHGDLDQPIPFARKQFPVTSALCMTINKAQGQSLDKVGVFLPGPAFAHGQLYVALSRCTSLKNLKVALATQVSHNKTTNIVCRDLIKS
jgi:ATP-dependent exoDNAse (exonuclease V) alpha subunit